jgi:hypothetical protein
VPDDRPQVTEWAAGSAEAAVGRPAHRCRCFTERIGLLERGVHGCGFLGILDFQEESSMGLILLIVLIVLLMGGFPSSSSTLSPSSPTR